MSPIAYDSHIIQRYASTLYARARAVLMLCILAGSIVGGDLGKIQGESLRADGYAPMAAGREITMFGYSPNLSFWGFVLGLIVGGAIGAAIGEFVGFRLKLSAQLALCQVQVEKNTRHLLLARSEAPIATTPSNTNAA